MLKVKNLFKTIGDKTILKNINITFNTGLTCIVGDSGAGKSTLVNILGGLDRPSKGNVDITLSLGDKSIFDMENYQRDYLGFVFQDANLVSGLTAKENIQLSEQIAGRNNSDKKVENTINVLGLSNIANEKVEFISGGERLRVSIGRAMVKDAPILLADEPTGNLDYENSIIIFELLKKLSKTKTVIVVTHNIEMAHKYADRIITIRDGEIINDDNIIDNVHSITLKEIHDVDKHTISKKIISILTINSIKRVKGKFWTIVFSIAVAVSTLAIIFSMQLNMNEKSAEMNEVYYDADLITFFEKPFDEQSVEGIVMGGTFSPISDEVVKDLYDSSMFSAIIPICVSTYYIDDPEENIDIKLINIDEFFLDRIMTEAVTGTFLTEDDQIILAADIAGKYFKDDAIGKNIKIKNDLGYEFVYKIVGINNEKNVDGKYFSYISANSVSDLKQTELMAYIFFEEHITKPDRYVFSEDSSGFLKKCTDEDIIFGEEPVRNNQIVISRDIARDLYYSLTGEYLDFSVDDIKNRSSLILQALNELIGKSYYLGANDAYLCNIVGVHNGSDYIILTSDSWFDIITQAVPNKIECYFENMQVAKAFKDSSLAEKYTYISNYEERFENAINTTNIWKLMFTIAILVVALLCIMLLNSYSKISITERIYEMGVLRTLGMRKREVQKILSFEICSLGFFAGLLSVFIYTLYTVFAVVVLKYTFNFSNLVGVSFIVFLSEIIICFLFGKKESKYATQTTIIDAIRARQ